MSNGQQQSEIRNRLGQEPSLYLRQHADNPVAWQPWDEEALALARDTGRPILLSIGYSACHWCHVMAHESFEDEETARVMNELYINIKVDREERPDLDKVYQLSHQLLTGRGGGWPLTLFLDPVEHIPFFAGTYFPLQARYGMPSFRDVLVRARQWFDQNPKEMTSQGKRLQEVVESLQRAPDVADAISPQQDDKARALAEQAGRELLARFDRKQGGFGGAPKFPQAPVLELAAVLGGADLPETNAINESLRFSLEKMAASGLRDHLDGGFFRYCVDDSWTIPHFEKMLYDNAQLLPLYAEASARSDNELLRAAAEGIAGWLLGQMLQHNGAFSASIDADAGGEEGGFHAWARDEVRELLTEPEYEAFAPAYGLDGPANFEGKAWHLVRKADGGDPDLLATAREKLWKAREERVHPTLDSKQLTSWNALAASGFLRAARAMGRDDWTATAQAVLDFIRLEQWDGNRLHAVHYDGEARIAGTLEDYAFTLDALMESLCTHWRRVDLELAMDIADSLLLRFEDKDHGGYFFSDSDQPTPIARSVVTQDDATPAAFAIAALALASLAELIGDLRYSESAVRAMARACAGTERGPLAFATVTRAIFRARDAQPQVLISGTDQQAAERLKQWAESRFQVKCYLLRAERTETTPREDRRPLPGLLAELRTAEPATAWVCHNMRCLPPVHTRKDLQNALEA